jgi:uncharacterized RDD family membrane protein YckC
VGFGPLISSVKSPVRSRLSYLRRNKIVCKIDDTTVLEGYQWGVSIVDVSESKSPALPFLLRIDLWLRLIATATLPRRLMYAEMRMKAREFRWLFLLVLATVLIVGGISKPTNLGASAEWSKDGYRFAGGTQVWALALSALIIGLYLLLMYSPLSEPKQTLPGVFRRFAAFWLDFILAMMFIAPILGLIPLFVEWRRTHVFEWNFERTVPASGDKLVLAAVFLLTFVALVFYYAFPLIRCKPSPGSCIAGYQIVADDGKPLVLRKAVLRALLGFVAVCTAYVAPFIARNCNEGKFWLDVVFRTRAVTLN